jgi:maleylpyruvate isomerase
VPEANLSTHEAVAMATALKHQVAAATERLLKTAASITDDQARAASLLPGWSRGHLLTHLARNADGLRNLLIWARTGTPTPMYPSAEARELGIAAGSGRPAADLFTDVRDASAAFAAETDLLTGAAWTATVSGSRRAPHPAWYTLWRRLSEVEVHHVDLGAGYGQRDWPADFVAGALPRVAGDLTELGAPAVAVVSSDSGQGYRIGPADVAPAALPRGEAPRTPLNTVRGNDRDLLAWLTGRSTGTGLAAEPPGPLPSLPAW